MSQGGPQLIPDKTLLVQLGIFLASYVCLRTLVIEPYVKLLHLRKEKTTGLSEKARKDKERSEALRHQYEDFMKAERKKINKYIEDERVKLSDEEKHIISQARNQVAADLAKQREALNAEADRARRDLKGKIGEFSSLIATKLLGTTVTLSEFGGSPTKRKEQVVEG